MALQQQPLAGMEPYKRPTNYVGLISLALSNNAAIDVIERLAALEREAKAMQAKIDFNEALNRVQATIKRIAPDMENPAKRSKYASYAAIDRVIRPIYSAEGFSLSFTHADATRQEHIRVIGILARGAHEKEYMIEMPVDTEGAKGTAMMTKTQGTSAADSYAKRYLVKDIFNIAVGEDDQDGELSNGWLNERIEWIENCRNLDELQRVFKNAYSEASTEKNNRAMAALIVAKDKKKAEL